MTKETRTELHTPSSPRVRFRVACVSEKEQERHCDTKARHGHHPRTSEGRGKIFTGDAE